MDKWSEWKRHNKVSLCAEHKTDWKRIFAIYVLCCFIGSFVAFVGGGLLKHL